MNARASCTHCLPRADDVTTLEVTCDECPQLPLRILGLIAQRDEVPERFECRRTDDAFEITLALPRSLQACADLLVARIEGMIGVHNVWLNNQKGEDARRLARSG